jgi:ABC-type phosphate/phosphonate transport system substrate-binding protein
MTKDPQGKEILQKLYGIDGLAEAKQSDFDVVRDAARFTNI